MKPPSLGQVALCAAVCAVVTAPAAADFLGAGQQQDDSSTADNDFQAATGAYFSTANPCAAFTLAGWLSSLPRHGFPYGDPVSPSPVQNAASVVAATDMPAAPGRSGVAPTSGAGGGGASSGGGAGSASLSPSGLSGADGPSVAETDPATAPGIVGSDLQLSPSGTLSTGQPDGATAASPLDTDAVREAAAPEPAAWVLAGLGLAVLHGVRGHRSRRTVS